MTMGEVVDRKNKLLLMAARQFEFYADNHQLKADALEEASTTFPLPSDQKQWEETVIKAATNRAWAKRLRAEAES